MKVATLQQEAHDNAVAKGFWDVPDEDLYRPALYAKLFMRIAQAMEFGRAGDGNSERATLNMALSTLFTLDDESTYYEPRVRSNATVLSKLALIITEVGEAVETFFCDGEDNLPEELADAVIRICDLAGGEGFDLEREIEAKMAKNKDRPAMHGKSY